MKDRRDPFKILQIWTDADDAQTGEENGFEAGKRWPFAHLTVIGPENAEKIGFEWIFVVHTGAVPPTKALLQKVKASIIQTIEGDES